MMDDNNAILPDLPHTGLPDTVQVQPYSTTPDELTSQSGANDSTLYPDLAAAQYMLQLLDPAPDAVFTFQTFDDNADRKDQQLARTLHGTLDQRLPQLTQLMTQGAGVFVTVNQTSGRRTAKDVTRVRALFVDFDSARPERLQELAEMDTAPTMIIESSPGKHHAYWIIDQQGDIPLDQFKPLQQRLIDYFTQLWPADGVDNGIHDLPRVMRLAGFYHQKVKAEKGQAGQPVMVNLVHEMDYYTAQEVMDWVASLPVSETVAPEKSKKKPQANITPEANNRPAQYITFEQAKLLARGHWPQILAQLGYPVTDDPDQHTACPACGGSDRFRFDNQNGDGSFICSQGDGHNIAGDGFALLEHAGHTPAQALQMVTGVLDQWGRISPYDAQQTAQPAGPSPTDEWPTPEPLEHAMAPPTPYPMTGWPKILHDAIEAIAHHAQVPLAMAGQCVLGALSALGQRFIDAPFFHGHIPASLYLITEGGSGCGKTQASSLSHRSLKSWDKDTYNKFRDDLDAWEAERNSLKGKELQDFLTTSPKPQNRTMLLSDATLEAVLDRYILNGVSNLSLTTDEAGQFFNGHSMKANTAGNSLSSLTKLWSSGEAQRVRSQRGDHATPLTNAYDVRLTLDIMGQRAILEPALADPLMNNQGFIPRCLLASPESLQGTRVWNTPERLSQNPDDDPRLLAYWHRCNILLNPPPPPVDHAAGPLAGMVTIQHAAQRVKMQFACRDTLQLLADFQQEIENKQGKGKPFEYLRGTASRMAENASRIAALVAFFEGQDRVEVSHLLLAFSLVRYSTSEVIRYIDARPQEKNAMQLLLECLIKLAQKDNTDRLNRSTISNNAPYAMRNNSRLLADTLDQLESAGYIRQHSEGRAKLTYLNPCLLNPPPRKPA